MNENTDVFEYLYTDAKALSLLLSSIFIAFRIKHFLSTKENKDLEKAYHKVTENFYFPNETIWMKVLCNVCLVCQQNNNPHNKTNCREAGLKKTFFKTTVC